MYSKTHLHQGVPKTYLSAFDFLTEDDTDSYDHSAAGVTNNDSGHTIEEGGPDLDKIRKITH